MTFELFGHIIVLLLAFGGTAWTVVFAGRLWASWVLVNVEGAARTVFVGHHGWRAKAYVLPHPLAHNNRATLLKGPLVRTEAYVDTDRDETNVQFAIAPEGAPSSTNESDRPQLRVRISWSTADVVPFYDTPGEPGDHDRIPPNLIIPQNQLASAIVQRFHDRGVYAFLPEASVDNNGGIRRFIPGAAAVVFMNKYVEGEHLERMYEFLRQHAIELFGRFHVRQLQRIAEEGAQAVVRRLDESSPLVVRIRGHEVELHGDRDRRGDPQDGPRYTPMEYRTMGEFRRIISVLLTKVLQIEMEPYGVFVNDVTVTETLIPEVIVAASRDREARPDQVESMRQLGAALAEQVETLRGQGMTPDVAGAYLADSIATTSRPGVIGVTLALLDRYFTRNS